MPAVVVLVGTSGSGKTTLRRRWVDEGLPAELVVSLDDLRREALADDVTRGRPPRPLQDYSAAAVRRAATRYDALAAFGAGYLADATHLRRRDRTPHVRAARETGLPSVAVLLPLPHLEELFRRDAGRPADERVPAEVLARQHHRRSLLSAGMLADEGFDEVLAD
jgi:predicted kinase